MLAAYAGINWYAGRWFVKAFSLNGAAGRMLPLLFAAIGILAFGVMRLRHFSFPGREFVAFAGFAWVGGILVISTVFALMSVLFFVLRKASVSVPAAYQAGITSAMAVLCLASAFYSGFRTPSLRHIEIKSAKLPPALDGYKLVHLSDLHLDSPAKMRDFRNVIERVNAQHPDLILITGDILDPGFDISQADGFFSGFRAREGVYASLGNHEYYFGMERAMELFGLSGLTLLHNSSEDLPSGIRLTGTGDVKMERFSAEEAASFVGKKPGVPEILLTHEPVYYKEFADRGIMLGLSGHTHRGQIFPFHLAVRMVYRYFYGHYSIGSSEFYVTSGTGSWGPRMRFLASPEIPVITLRSVVAVNNGQKTE